MLDSIISLIYALPAVVVAITVHEYSHARAAYALGDPTPKAMGRVTLDPLAHIDWIGIICLALCGFGWGKPVEIHSGYFKKPKRDICLTAIAGPLSNLALALVSGLVYVLVAGFSVRLGNAGAVMLKLLAPFVTWNTLLFAFNIIPVPPLDGYKVVRGLSHNPNSKFFQFMDRYGMFVLLILVISGLSSRFIGLVSSIVSLPMQTMSQLLFK